MDPIEVVETLDAMIIELDRLRAALSAECKEAQMEWKELRRLGAQRQNHAASLLRNVAAYGLAPLAQFVNQCLNQLDKTITASQE